MKLTLFTGPHCGLCDQAKSLLNTLRIDELDIDEKNVRECVDLYHLYGARIPVIKRHDTLDELAWPFDLEQLKTFLQ
ncbi:glutaredoxin family protein [Agaribacter flavus]|uniref:Glutaredoxin family protein n=1 Tax=Agaribacter flavus TaxID=1902781 RepID=A0ABV7FT88_9ALTE